MQKQESSARLTNQRISYVFISSTLSFHACHILPTSKFQHSYFCILQASVNSMCENCECKTVHTVHWFDASCSVIPVYNSKTLISPVQAGLHFTYSTSWATFFAADSLCGALQISEQFSPKPERQPIGCRARTRF